MILPLIKGELEGVRALPVATAVQEHLPLPNPPLAGEGAVQVLPLFKGELEGVNGPWKVAANLRAGLPLPNPPLSGEGAKRKRPRW